MNLNKEFPLILDSTILKSSSLFTFDPDVLTSPSTGLECLSLLAAYSLLVSSNFDPFFGHNAPFGGLQFLFSTKTTSMSVLSNETLCADLACFLTRLESPALNEQALDLINGLVPLCTFF